MNGNIIVGQSGGPTSVINASLAGVFKTAKTLGASKVFGMKHGVAGLLKEEYVDLEQHIKNDLDIELLKRTPASFLGTCRYKFPKLEDSLETYENMFRILNKLEIKHFFYIGGNDSMDTINKLSSYGASIGSDITFIGVPKTIDNDLANTDHTPGFGSAAKYIASSMKEIIQDAKTYDSDSITVVEIMGRNAGWLTAAAALSRSEDCAGPDLLYLPEVSFDYDDFLKSIIELKKEKRAVVIGVSEGVKLANGSYVSETNKNGITIKDAFGHTQLGGTALYLSDFLVRETGIKSRGVNFSTLQRCASHLVSRRDITEAYAVGADAVRLASFNDTGKMVTLVRTSSDPYHVITGTCDIAQAANFEKKVPMEWIENGNYVSKEFIEYASPLIVGELSPFMVEGLPRHLFLEK